MDRERKGEGRHSQSPPGAGSITTWTPSKLLCRAGILNAAQRSEGSGPRMRNLLRTPDPSAPPQDDTRANVSNPGGFTLIELLVVIAVIALLMAILLPVLGRVRSQARALRCRANLKQWGQVLAVYLDDNQGCLPAGDMPAAVWLLRGAMPAEEVPQKPDLIQPVYTTDIACCPLAVRARHDAQTTVKSGTDSWSWRVQVWLGSTLEAWEVVHPPPSFRASYGFNEWLLTNTFGLRGTRLKPQLCLNVFSLRGKANMPALLDCTQPCSRPDQHAPPPPEPSARWIMSSTMAPFCINRHDAHGNALFLDWSARRVGLKELWTLKWHRDYDMNGPWTKAGGVEPGDWPKWMRHFKDY